MIIDKNSPKVIKEQNNIHYICKLFNIIYYNYLFYPNYSHFFNKEKIYRFLIKSNNKEENEIEENKDLNFINRNKLDEMTVVYKNSKEKIKLFGKKFIENNKRNSLY